MGEKLGDEDFKNFIDGNDGDDDDQIPDDFESGCPRVNEMTFIVSTIKEKMKFIDRLFKEALMRYEKITSDDLLKEKMRDYILTLMTCSIRTMEQLDYALIDDSIIDDSPETGDKDKLS
jgi:hypothetical protein